MLWGAPKSQATPAKLSNVNATQLWVHAIIAGWAAFQHN